MSSHGPPQKKHGAGGAGSPSQRAAPPPKLKKQKELKADFLLNFQRPPSHQRPQNQYAPPPRSKGSGRTQYAPVAFAKGRFVQSSFRLFVDDVTPDVVEAAFNADSLLQWESVRRVDLMCDTLPKCPICLETEFAVPKITRCGHIYCLPCIIRYFRIHRDSNGKNWQKCPVCVEQVSLKELTSVRFEEKKAIKENDKLRFVLAQRDFSSTVVRFSAAARAVLAAESDERVDASADVRDGLLRLPREGDMGWHLSRLVQFAPGEYSLLVEDELEALRQFRTICVSDGESELLPSVDEALVLMRKQRPQERLGDDGIGDNSGQRELASANMGEEDRAAREEPSFSSRAVAAAPPPNRTSAAGAASSLSSPLDQPSSPPLDHASSPDLGPSALPPESFDRRTISFYQVSDGRLVFFEPFFSKILLHEHGGSWNSLPATLDDVRVERLHETTVSEDTRKRHKFLSHLPLGSLVSFAEVDLRNYLGRDTKEHFADEFAKRRQQRKKDIQRDLKQERISKTRAAEEEERYYRELGRSHPSTLQLPPTKEDFAVDLHGRVGDTVAEADAQVVEGADVEQAQEPEESGPTLADKLKQKMTKQVRAKDRAPAYPDLSSTAGAFPELPMSAGNASSSASSAWGRGRGSSLAKKDSIASSASQAVASSAPVGPPPDSWDSEEEPTFGAALEAALRNAGSGNVSSSPKGAAHAAAGGSFEAEEEEPPDPVGSGAAVAGGKKKKGRAGKATTIRLFG